MELPSRLRSLYKHWQKHLAKPVYSAISVFDRQTLDQLIYLINERLAIFEKKENGLPRPYTNDIILSQYRFCNIYREFDKQTVFYHTLLKELENDFPLWLLNMLFCRSICNIETINNIGLLSFDKANNEEVQSKLTKMTSPKYGNAYIFPISLIQQSKWKTRECFFCQYYPSVIKKVAETIITFHDVSVVDALQELLPIFGFNLKFLWTEVLIDVAYQYPQYINLYKKFPIGPGSAPTMKLLQKDQDVEFTNLQLVGMLDHELNLPTMEGKPIYLSAENWEGIGCEFRKYRNLKDGKGRKRRYSN